MIRCSKCGRVLDDTAITRVSDVAPTETYCGVCGGIAETLGQSPVAGILAAAMNQPREPGMAGLDVPSSFFDISTGRLMPPPWVFGKTTIDIVKRPQTITIVVPVSALANLTNTEISELCKFTEALGKAFERMVPAGWKVVT